MTIFKYDSLFGLMISLNNSIVYQTCIVSGVTIVLVDRTHIRILTMIKKFQH